MRRRPESTTVDVRPMVEKAPHDVRQGSTMRRTNHRPDTSALCHIGLDSVMDRDQLEELAFHTDVVTVSRGTVLATLGRSARQFIAVIDGHVDVTDRSGRTFVAG